ncbi:MAG: O-succinylhomoserine sulfhydrylase [Magnetococcales bacterium]|nr:O-succinylhomoserine sulfhydrylase [Magnetococcales bacterium]
MTASKNRSPKSQQMATTAIHSGRHQTQERENSPPLFLTSSFTFHSAQQAAAVFAGEENGNLYSRFTNPTVAAFEERIATLEGGERGVAMASGMAAITSVFLGLLAAGDHLVLSRSVFGSTSNLANGLLTDMGIDTTQVPLSNLDAWRQAVRPETKLFFVETPSNPTLEMVDLTALSQLARERNILVAVDNVFCTPCLQRPLALGADLVIHSATKYLDGQGRVLGGVVIGSESLITEKIYPILRNAGPTLSPFNAWVLYKGMETLPLRMERHCDNSQIVAEFLAEQPLLASRVNYPGLSSHPQHQLAARQMDRFGGIVCVDLGSRERAYTFINGLELATITANLGDVRTLVTHPASTTHAKLSEENRLAVGITQGLVRFSIGLEAADDICEDLLQALHTLPYR